MNSGNSVKVLWCLMVVLGTLLIASCSSSKKIDKDYLYFQRGLDSMGPVRFADLVIQPNDVLNIQIYSKTTNQEQAALYNIANTATSGTAGYLVNNNGEIEIPVLGNIHASGLTRVQLQQRIIDKLSPYVKLPGVIVHIADFKINILGDVKVPGSKSFLKERVTIIDAISAAGDLNETGKRYDIMVIREEYGVRHTYNIDLRSASLFQSPAYQLKQNDIVYVGASDKKLKLLNLDPESQRRTTMIFTVVSLVLSIGTVIISFIN